MCTPVLLLYATTLLGFYRPQTETYLACTYLPVELTAYTNMEVSTVALQQEGSRFECPWLQSFYLFTLANVGSLWVHHLLPQSKNMHLEMDEAGTLIWP